MKRPPPGRKAGDFFLVTDSTGSLTDNEPARIGVDAAVLTGTTVGNYRLEERLGAGGMGEVYRGTHSKLGGTVAIKLIQPDRLRSPNAARRFLREVQASAKLDHPNIVRAVDAGEDAGRYYLVLEYLDGEDLESLVQRTGALSFSEVYRAGRDLGLALQYLHEQGLVHRDVKPANLIRVRKTGVVKLLDLGLTRFAAFTEEDSSGSTTQHGVVLGTPDFIAPEQAINPHRADIRSDIYSAGCTIYYLLTGSVPFPGGGPVEKLIRQHQDIPPDVAALRRDVPRPLAVVVARMMAKTAENRFRSPAELVKALAEAEKHPPTVSTPTPLPTEDSSPFNHFLDPDSKVIPLPKQRRRPPERRPKSLWWVPAAVLVVGITLALSAFFLRNRSTPNTPTTEADTPAAAEEDPRRSRLFSDLSRTRGTPEAVAIAGQLRETTSPFDRFPSTTVGLPSLLIGSPERRHQWGASAVAVAADGRTVATGGEDRLLRLWELPSFKARSTFTGHRCAINGVDIAPDGTRVLATTGISSGPYAEGGERRVVVWNTSGGAEVLRLGDQAEDWTVAGQFVGSSRFALLGQYKAVTLWDLDRRQELRAYIAPTGLGWAGKIGVSADRKSVFASTVTDEATRLHIWDYETGEHLRVLPHTSGTISAIVSCPDNRRLALVSTDGSVRLWDYRTGDELDPIRIPRNSVTSAAWADAEVLVIGCEDGTLHWFDTDTGSEMRSGSGHFGPITGVAVTPTVVISTGADGSLRKWDSKTGRELDPLPAQAPIAELQFADRDRRLMVLPEYGRPVSLSVERGQRIGPEMRPADWFPIGLSADGDVALGSLVSRRRLARWRMSDAAPEVINWEERGIGRRPAVAHDARRLLYAARSDRVVRWTDLTTGQVLEEFPFESSVESLALSPNDRLAAVITRSNRLTVHDLSSGSTVVESSVGSGRARQMIVSPDSRMVYIAFGEVVWSVSIDAGTPNLIRSAGSLITAFAISPDNRTLVIGTVEGDVIQYAIDRGTARTFRAAWPIKSLALSMDSRGLAVGFANGMIAIYTLPR